MDALDDLLKSMYEIKIKSDLTLCYKDSIHGGLFGFIKEMANTICHGKNLDELISKVLKDKKVVEYLDGIE